MLAIALALASSLSYGCADFAGGLATRNSHVLRVAVVAAPASFALEMLLLPVLGGHWSAGSIGWGAASGVGSAASFVLLYQCLALGPMGILSPVTALVSALLPAAVGLALGERLTAAAATGIALALVAVLVISSSGTGGQRPKPYALLLAIGAGAAIAAQLICLSQSPAGSGVTPLVAGRAVSGLTMAAVFLARRRTLPGPQAADDGGSPPGGVRAVLRANRAWRLAALAGVLDALANMFFLFATHTGELAIVAVICALYPAGTVLLARAVLGERLSRVQVGGLAMAAAAVSLLALPR